MRRRGWWLVAVVAGLLLMCNLPLTQVPGGTPVGSAATLTAIFAQVPTLIPTIQAATATPVQPLVATPTPALPTPPGPLRQGGTVVAHHRTAAILIDGFLDEWPVRTYRADKVVYGANLWEGPEDVSAVFTVLWDEQALYLAVEVTDDVYAQSAQGFYIFQGDEIEVLVDRDLYGDFTSTVLNDDDYSLGLAPGQNTPGNSPEAYLWFPVGLRGPRPQVIFAARSTGQAGGYVVEARIPWEVFGAPPSAGTYLGFALRISDNDLPGQQVQQSMVANVPPPHVYNNPTTWGNLVLVP